MDEFGRTDTACDIIDEMMLPSYLLEDEQEEPCVSSIILPYDVGFDDISVIRDVFVWCRNMVPELKRPRILRAHCDVLEEEEKIETDHNEI